MGRSHRHEAWLAIAQPRDTTVASVLHADASVRIPHRCGLSRGCRSHSLWAARIATRLGWQSRRPRDAAVTSVLCNSATRTMSLCASIRMTSALSKLHAKWIWLL